MNYVEDILNKKGSKVITINDEDSVFDAAKVIAEHKFGALVVISKASGDIVGIVSERDMVKIISTEKDAKSTLVKEIMTKKIVVCNPKTTILECEELMVHNHIRHIPVVEEGKKLIGIISARDAQESHIEIKEMTIQHLQDYFLN